MGFEENVKFTSVTSITAADSVHTAFGTAAVLKELSGEIHM
jgi:hypothetical protein